VIVGFLPAYSFLAIAALLLPAPRIRLLAALGLPAFALGAASVGRLPPGTGPGPTLWICAGLLLLGPATLAAASWRVRQRIPAGGGTPAIVGVAILTAVLAAWATLRAAGIIPALLTTGALALGALTLWVVGQFTRLGTGIRALDARMAPARARLAGPGVPAGARSDWFLAVGMLAALFGPYLSVVFLGAIVAAIAGHLRGRRLGTTGRVPVLWVAVPLLAAAWWLAATVAGPEMQSLSALPGAPFSPEAELLLSLAVALAAALFAGLWPLHGVLPGGGVALAAGALLLRLAIPAWPLGVEHWQPLAVAAGVASAWWAVPTRRVPLATAGLAFAAGFAIVERAPGAWLLLAALALRGQVPAWATTLLMAAGGYLVAAPLLGAEVVYTVLLAGAATALLASLASEAPSS